MTKHTTRKIDYTAFSLDPLVPASWEPLVLAWSEAYQDALESESNLWVIEPRAGVSYLFDDATIGHPPRHDAPTTRDSRVVAAWGVSAPPQAGRDTSRMRGHPRPSRMADDRGHLFAAASGGGYDINLIPMDSSLNRGRSPQGKILRQMERICASNPGTFFFARPTYNDGSGRPESFDFGVQLADRLWVETLSN